MALFGMQTPQEKAMNWAKNQSNVAEMDLSGRPQMAAFQSQLGPGGMMPEQYQIQDQLNRGGLEKIRGIALGEGPSAWAQARGQELQTQQAQGMSDLAAQSQSAQAQARGQMARRGGISSGARERMAMGGAQSNIMNQQRARLGGQQAREGLATEDERRKSQMLQQLPGQEIQSAQFGRAGEQFNIQRALQEKQAERSYNMQKYQADSQAWAAQKQAEAIRASKSKGFLEQAGSFGGAMGGGGAGGMFGL